MKKLLLLTGVLILAVGGTLSAQETFINNESQIWKEIPWSLGGSFEYSANTREQFAYGYGISIDRYLFTPFVAAGLRGNMHNDGISISATEILLNVRGYAPLTDNISLFTQLGFGAAFYTEEGRERNTYTLDLTAGSRVYITASVLRGFYVEPYIRTGFPFLFSGGIAIGHWFNF
jgi:hypothetical protein